ncbi:hypothetical protein [Providencia rettgeri]|uniref:hypothetical protein n=1 Tax=Providencia rettgeri TaxID=587 RepID=UPI0021D4FB80|nr:hypothetical protein [Providencia rettgeri]WIE09592.1 hypothetical protein N4838_007055 [Providencia rettgeri]
MFNPELKPLQPARPGNALLTIRNWDGEHENVSLTIQRNQDGNYLNDKGEWVGNAFEIQLSFELNGDDLHIVLDKTFVDPLVSNLQMAYRFTLKDDEGNEDKGTLKIHNGVLSSLAQGQQDVIPSGGSVVPTIDTIDDIEPEPIIEPVEAVAEIPPAPKPIIEKVALVKTKKPPVMGIIIALILLLIIAALVWFFLFKNKSEEPAPAAPAQTSAPANGIEGACSVDSMKSGEALAFVQNCLKSHPSDVEIVSTIDAAIANNQCDIAQRLYAYKAQAGDAKIAFKYAQEYDPNNASSGKCFSPDKETAIYWYEVTVNNDSQNSDAKARLEALKK